MNTKFGTALTVFLRTFLFVVGGFLATFPLLYLYNALHLPEGDDVWLFIFPSTPFIAGIWYIVHAKKVHGNNWYVGVGGILGLTFTYILLLFTVPDLLYGSLSSYSVFNLLEGLFWILLSCVPLAATNKIPRIDDKLLLFSSYTLFLFGISDFVEVFMGSFFEPNMMWLLIWKVFCVVSLVFSILWYFKIRLKE